MPLLVRRYRPGDAAATRACFEQAIRVTAAQDYSPAQVAAWAPPQHDAEAWAARRAAADTWVAEDDGRVVGFCDLIADGLVDMLFVHPDAAGQGVARALVERVVDEARRRGLTRLHTHASRTARPAFEALGFVVDRDNDPNWVRGTNVPNHDMHRDL